MLEFRIAVDDHEMCWPIYCCSYLVCLHFELASIVSVLLSGASLYHASEAVSCLCPHQYG